MDSINPISIDAPFKTLDSFFTSVLVAKFAISNPALKDKDEAKNNFKTCISKEFEF